MTNYPAGVPSYSPRPASEWWECDNSDCPRYGHEYLVKPKAEIQGWAFYPECPRCGLPGHLVGEAGW